MKRTIGLLLPVLLLLTGCVREPEEVPRSTAAETTAVLDGMAVYEKIRMATGGKPAAAFTVTTELGAGLRAATFSLEAEASAVTKVITADAPFAYYSDAAFQASLFGMEFRESFQVYSKSADDGLQTYFHVGGSDAWYRCPPDLTPAQQLGQYAVTGCPAEWEPENLTLTHQPDGSWLLDCTFPAGEVLGGINGPFGNLTGAGADLSGLQMDASYYVDGTTFLPTRVEIRLRGVGDLFSDLIGRYAGTMLPGLAGVKTEVTEYREVLSDLSYSPVDVPDVPAEGLRRSVDISG